MPVTKRDPAPSLPACVEGCAPWPFNPAHVAWAKAAREDASKDRFCPQIEPGWHRFGPNPRLSEITREAIAIVGCPCRLEQLLRLPGLSAANESRTMANAAARWNTEVEDELERMVTVERHLRKALEVAGDALGLEYGLRITHAATPKIQGGEAVLEPRSSPINIAMRDALALFAERLKEDAARRRGSLDERGLHLRRPGEHGEVLQLHAFSPQDRLIGNEDDLSRSLLTDAATAKARAQPPGAFRSAYAKAAVQQVAALKAALPLPDWDNGTLADLIAASCRDWQHPPTDLKPSLRYDPAKLASDNVNDADTANAQRKRLMQWLTDHQPEA